MGKTVLPMATVLAAMLATLLALAAPAYPQVSSEDLAADEEGNLIAPRPPNYEATEGGMLIIGGDLLVPCSEVGRPSDPPGAGGYSTRVRAEWEQARRESIRACRVAGFDTAGGLPSDNVSASMPAGSTTASASPGTTDPTLPDTGGFALPVPLVLAAGVALAAGGLLAARARR